MRTTARLTLAAFAVGGGVLLGAPAAVAQDAPCAYPFDCPPAAGGGSTTPGSGGGGGGSGTSSAGGGSGSGAELPFTGGELVLLTATGAGALAAGTALLAAGRRRSGKV